MSFLFMLQFLREVKRMITLDFKGPVSFISLHKSDICSSPVQFSFRVLGSIDGLNLKFKYLFTEEQGKTSDTWLFKGFVRSYLLLPWFCAELFLLHCGSQPVCFGDSRLIYLKKKTSSD